jgi:N-acetylneuraminic acid mutarotase
VIEVLESRRLMATNLAVDFHPSGTTPAAGAYSDTGAPLSKQNGLRYGWNANNDTHTFARPQSSKVDATNDSFALMQGRFGTRRWQIALPDGTYRVTVSAGDAARNTTAAIAAEGRTVVSGSTTSANRFAVGVRRVVVRDGYLTLTNASPDATNAINFVRIKAIVSPDTSTDGDRGAEAPVTSTPSSKVKWPASSAWRKAASAPIARFESHAFSYGGKLYVLGGWADSRFNSTKRVERYDPVTNKWTRLRDMKAPETHAGMALDAKNGVVYFVGGHRGRLPSTPSRDVWKYTIGTDTWTKMNVRTPYSLGGQAAGIVGNKLYTFGGNPADRYSALRDTLMLDLSRPSAGFKKVATFPLSRDHLSGVVIGKYIYAIGGEFGHDRDHDQQAILQRFDPSTNKWTRLANAPGEKSHAESSTFVLNGKIIFAGGQVQPQAPTSSVYQYDPATGKWSRLSSLPQRRQGTVVLPVGNAMVFTTGGIYTNQPQKATYVVKFA